MKEIKLRARLSAYSKVDAIKCSPLDIESMTPCDVDKLFGKSCNTCCDVVSNKNEVSCADIDKLFS